jgi:hypothetical protein
MSDSGSGCHLSQRIQIGESKQLLIGVSFTGCLFTIHRPVEKGEGMVVSIGLASARALYFEGKRNVRMIE